MTLNLTVPVLALAFGAGLFASASAGLANEPQCAQCATEIVVSPESAECFLDKYEDLISKKGANVVVDLSDCATSRGGIPGLPTPVDTTSEEPSRKFVIPRAHVECLKKKIEELVVKAPVRIELASCG